GSWFQRTFPGLSSANGISYGGVATFGHYAFLSDMRTFGSPEDIAQGIVRFDLNDDTAIRFAQDIGPIDVNIGLDGLLYALYPGGSPDGPNLAVYDPESMTYLRTISLSNLSDANLAIAVDRDGSLFVGTLYGDLYHVATNGSIVGSLTLPPPLVGGS